MKKISLLFATCCMYYFVSAQWSDTQNKFYDTLLMPVTTNSSDQYNPIIVRSYPDEGYFVIWEDYRNGDEDIYAQKYSKSGAAQWSTTAAVAKGAANQFYDFGDYRYYNHVCTDSAGGFYIAFENGASTGLHNSYVQHIKSNGKKVFSGLGYLLLQSNYYSIVSPQLIADGNKGFYVGYLRLGAYGERDLFVYCYRDENDSLHYYGGGQMNQNLINKQQSSPCGIQNLLQTADATVDGYMIYSDNQGGCNIAMSMIVNTGTAENAFVGFNRLCRVKKKCTVTLHRRVDSIAGTKKIIIHYPKDSIVRLYSLTTFSNTVICGSEGNTTAVTSYYVENGGEGYLPISGYYYNLGAIKGTIASANGKLNADIIGCDTRNYVNNSVTEYHIHAFSIPEEIYDSVPYQLASNAAKPFYAFNNIWPSSYPTLRYFSDTALYSYSPSGFEFSLSTAANRIFFSGTTDQGNVMLQELDVKKINADSFAIKLNTSSKNGIIIGRNVYTGYQGTGIAYSDPYIAGDNNGNAVFCITDYGRYPRISPIDSNAQLRWGAMGRAVASSASSSIASLLLDPGNGTGVISFYKPAYGQDIVMRHLDNLDVAGYPPVIKPTRLYNFYNQCAPSVMLGTSNALSLFETWDNTGKRTPIFEMTDNYKLGAVQSSVFEESLVYPQRSYNGRYYLGRNYSIVPDSAPSNNTFTLRLYFTKAEFDSLKSVAHTVTLPSDLVAIQQPTNSGAYEYYAPVTGEKTLTPTKSATIPGGYYLEFKTKKLGNFFLFEKGTGITAMNAIAESNSFIKNVYPSNILQGQLHIETGNMKLANMIVELYSEDGKLLLQKKLSYQSQTINVDANTAGVFKLKISSGNKVFTTNIFNTR